MKFEELQQKVSTCFVDKPLKRGYLFSSFLVKGNKANDIDLIVDFEKTSKFSLWDHARYVVMLENVLGKKLDLLSLTAIKSNFMFHVKNKMKLLYQYKTSTNPTALLQIKNGVTLCSPRRSALNPKTLQL